MAIFVGTDLRIHEDTPVLNILTVAAVNVACFAGLTVTAQAAGLVWAWSLLVGWLGGGGPQRLQS